MLYVSVYVRLLDPQLVLAKRCLMHEVLL